MLTNNEGKMTSVNYPETWSWNGSALVSTAGPTYTYSFDAMYRPTGLKDQNNNTVVNNVTYNAANQLLTFNTETRQYNNLNQMTRLTITGSQPLDISYNFPAGTNNGKISSQLDNLSAETVTYQYDSLNRLLSASSSQSWSETYGFDAFGNLLSKAQVGGAPTLSQTVNTANNQIVGQSYDANGNQLSSPLGTLAYDAENRIASMSASGAQYAYDSRNKQVWRSILSAGNLSQQVYIYGVDGQKIGTYTFTLAMLNNSPEMTNSPTLLATFFGGKRVGTFDRLGSAKYNPNLQPQSFYPYGEDRGTVEPNDSLKFATYTRDAATGLDYADQRYYASNFGRFMSPDTFRTRRGRGSVNASNPLTWNRYIYAGGDPVNQNDPSGRDYTYCVGGGGESGGDEGDDTGTCYYGDDDQGDPPVEDPTPDDGCTEDGCPDSPDAPAQTPPAPEPECDVKEQYARVPLTLGLGVHTYLDVEINGLWQVIEGNYSGTGPFAPGNQLQVLITPGLTGGLTVPGGGDLDHPASDKTVWDAQKNAGLSPEQLCADAMSILKAAQNLQTNHAPGSPGAIPYNLIGANGIPNSNSLTRYLLTFAPDFGTVPHPRRARGWSNLILGQ